MGSIASVSIEWEQARRQLFPAESQQLAVIQRPIQGPPWQEIRSATIFSEEQGSTRRPPRCPKEEGTSSPCTLSSFRQKKGSRHCLRKICKKESCGQTCPKRTEMEKEEHDSDGQKYRKQARSYQTRIWESHWRGDQKVRRNKIKKEKQKWENEEKMVIVISVISLNQYNKKKDFLLKLSRADFP